MLLLLFLKFFFSLLTTKELEILCFTTYFLTNFQKSPYIWVIYRGLRAISLKNFVFALNSSLTLTLKRGAKGCRIN
jgi:hypothetical protein